MEHMLDDHFVMYDDLGCCGVNEWRKEVLLSMIDIRYESTRPTVITTNMTKKSMEDQLGFRSASRLFDTANLVIDMTSMPDRRKEKKNSDPEVLKEGY